GLLVVLAIGFSLVPYDGRVGGLFLSLGTPAYLLGLVFLLAFVRHEDDPGWRRSAVVAVTVVGAALALAGLVGGSITGKFLLPYGALAAVLGLLYLWSAIGLLGATGDLGYRLALALGVLGGLTVITAVVR